MASGTSSTMKTVPFNRTRSSKEFIEYIVDKRGWSDLSEDHIMVIGCGDRRNSTLNLVYAFPHFKSFIGIDSRDCSSDWICLDIENTHFHVADIEDITTLEKWIGGITKIISHKCFNFVEDHRKAFRNIFHLLTPGGEAVVSIVLQDDQYDWLFEYSWMWRGASRGKYLKPWSHIHKFRAPYYKDMLNEIGFKVLECEDEPIVHVFDSDDECKDHLSGMSSVVSGRPIDNIQSRKESFRIFMKYAGRNENGCIAMKSVVLRVIVEKPNE